MKDEKFINKLKDDIRGLQKANASLMQEVKEARAHLTTCDQACQAMAHENMAAKRLIWAILNTNGGRCDIPDSVMVIAGDPENQIKSWYDPSTSKTVMQAITEVKSVIEEKKA